MSSNLILFVLEGQKKEKQVVESFQKFFGNKDRVILSAYCTTIYNLYKKLKTDEDVSVLGLLKENPVNAHLKEYKETSFSEVYLFFDYDGHTNLANDNHLVDALTLFNEETENGKLYISYPMLESLKHYNDSIDFKILTVNCKQDIQYKKLVNKVCDNSYKN